MNSISAKVKSIPAIMSEYEIQKLPFSPPRRILLLRRIGYSFPVRGALSAAPLTFSMAFCSRTSAVTNWSTCSA